MSYYTNYGNSTLCRVRKHFPHVYRIKDSRKKVVVMVKPIDSVGATKKDPATCALAKACVREHIAEGALIGLTFSYLIKGKVATRYKTPVTVSREIVSFDRHQDFDVGPLGKKYSLNKISPSQRIGMGGQRGVNRNTGKKKGKPMDVVHRTANIRVSK